MHPHDFTGFAGGLVRSFAWVVWAYDRGHWGRWVACASSDSRADAERMCRERGGRLVLPAGERPAEEERA